MDRTIVQRELQCHACAGQTEFVPDTGMLTCLSCSTERDLSHPDDDAARDEFAFDPDTPHTEAKVADGMHVHACTACGGEIVFTGKAISEHCPYCDGPVVLGPEEHAYKVSALIPFATPEIDAQAHALAWARGRWAAPPGLNAVVAKGRVSGLYAPFWTFDSNEAVQYWGSYTTGSGDNRRTVRVSGRMKTSFDDLLVPASHHVTPLIRDGILHDFRPNRLRAFQAGYLAGFAAERHHQTVAEGLRANAADKDLLLRARIRGRINKRSARVTRYITDTTGIHYRRIFVPVWILHYTYGETPYKIVVSGIDGRTFGERPFSNIKLAAFSGVITALTIAIGWAWGAAGFL